MPRVDEINSTEKLLNVIRKGKHILPADDSSEKDILPRKAIKSPPKRILSLQKDVNVGVDIGLANIRLVKTHKISETSYRLLDYKNIPYPTTLSKGTQEFAYLLKDSIQNFCSSNAKFNLWAVMSAVNIEVRHIRIPKVPKKQIENAVYWTYKKESPFDDKENIFDFEIQGEIIDQGIPKYSVMVYTAPKQEIEEIKSLFSGIGLKLIGISITPFAIQNLFRTNWIDIPDETIASLFIGNDFSRIDIFSKGNLVMTRGIKSGTNSMLEALTDVITMPGKLETIANKDPITREQARKILFSLSPDSPPLSEKDAGYGLKDDEIFAIILPALDRLIRQIERTFEYYTVTLGNEKINKIFISGVMDIYLPLVDYLGNQLGINREILDPLGSKISQQSRPSISEDINISSRAAYVPALGLALSDNMHTPNLSYTYKDKEKDTKIGLVNRGILVGFVICLCMCAAVIAYQINTVSQKNAILMRSHKELAQYSPRIDRNVVLKMIGHNKQQSEATINYGERYMGMAAISELSSMTPTNIRLTDLKIMLTKQSSTEPNETAEDKKETDQNQYGSLIIEGIVFGDKMKNESTLGEFIMKLDASPLFHHIVVQKSSTQKVRSSDILQFTLNLKIG